MDSIDWKCRQPKHPVKIIGKLTDCLGGTWRYDFVINPLVPDSGVFRFMRYCLECDRDKKNAEGIRKLIATDLRMKHRKCWERYYLWEDEQ